MKGTTQLGKKEMVTKENVSDKRKAILNGTLRLIAERGFHDTPMSKIAKESGVSAGIIYHYFANKDELIIALFSEIKRRVFQTVLTGYSADATYRQRYLYLWKNMLRFYKDHPLEARFLEQYENSPYHHADHLAQFAEEMQPFMDLFSEGVADEVIKALPLDIVGPLSFEVAVSLGSKHALGQIVLTDDLIEQAAEASWDAVKR